MPSDELFDLHASTYVEDLERGLSVSGEGREYFAKGRVAWLKGCLAALGESPASVLDFGCGDGFTTPLLLSELDARLAIGTDVSGRSLDIGRAKYGKPGVITFELLGDFRPTGRLDLAYCNGVFHHIRPPERAGAVELVRDALRPGGLFSLWENNPWSPATRYVMSRCVFDRDAIALSPPEARAMLRQRGFDIVRTDFRFVFPRALRLLRGLEDLIFRVPVGSQYQVLARKRR
jgi:SAM-dependent methyltransferase